MKFLIEAVALIEAVKEAVVVLVKAVRVLLREGANSVSFASIWQTNFLKWFALL